MRPEQTQKASLGDNQRARAQERPIGQSQSVAHGTDLRATTIGPRECDVHGVGKKAKSQGHAVGGARVRISAKADAERTTQACKGQSQSTDGIRNAGSDEDTGLQGMCGRTHQEGPAKADATRTTQAGDGEPGAPKRSVGVYGDSARAVASATAIDASGIAKVSAKRSTQGMGAVPAIGACNATRATWRGPAECRSRAGAGGISVRRYGACAAVPRMALCMAVVIRWACRRVEPMDVEPGGMAGCERPAIGGADRAGGMAAVPRTGDVRAPGVGACAREAASKEEREGMGHCGHPVAQALACDDGVSVPQPRRDLVIATQATTVWDVMLGPQALRITPAWTARCSGLPEECMAPVRGPAEPLGGAGTRWASSRAASSDHRGEYGGALTGAASMRYGAVPQGVRSVGPRASSEAGMAHAIGAPRRGRMAPTQAVCRWGTGMSSAPERPIDGMGPKVMTITAGAVWRGPAGAGASMRVPGAIRPRSGRSSGGCSAGWRGTPSLAVPRGGMARVARSAGKRGSVGVSSREVWRPVGGSIAGAASRGTAQSVVPGLATNLNARDDGTSARSVGAWGQARPTRSRVGMAGGGALRCVITGRMQLRATTPGRQPQGRRGPARSARRTGEGAMDRHAGAQPMRTLEAHRTRHTEPKREAKPSAQGGTGASHV